MKKLTLFALLFAIFCAAQGQNVDQSILAQGTWIKLSVDSDGFYKITYDDLISYGITPENINKQQLGIFGQSAGMLSESLSDIYQSDLQEFPIWVSGSETEPLNQNDLILFYGQSPHRWKYDTESNRFSHQKHLYSDNMCYFLTTDKADGLRITQAESIMEPADLQVSSYDYLDFIDNDQVNIIKSGKLWVGENLVNGSSLEYSFNIPNLLTQENIYLKTTAVAQSQNPSTLSMLLDYDQQVDHSLEGQNDSYTKGRYNEFEDHFLSDDDQIELTLSLSTNEEDAEAWLDYLEINARASLVYNNAQFHFRDTESWETANVSEFIIESESFDNFIFDVTNPLEIHDVPYNQVGNQIILKSYTNQLKEYVMFELTDLNSPLYIETIANQNIHNLNNIDFIIITSEDFLNHAEQLADIHRQEDNMEVTVVLTSDIYNEYSSGIQDISAIRNFIRHMYEKENSPLQFVALFGMGSYDYKNILPSNSNFVPIFQTESSLNLVGSIATDDFFVAVESNAKSTLASAPNVSVGRIPVRNQQEAQAYVDKVEHYYQNPFGAYKNDVVAIADDENGSVHVHYCERHTDTLMSFSNELTHKKIYIDQYEQIDNGEDGLYPQAHQQIVESFNSGALINHYTGHGGHSRFAHENIFTLEDLDDLSDVCTPLQISGTCNSITIDDPDTVSIIDRLLLREEGGILMGFANNRLALASINYNLSDRFYKHLFEMPSQERFPAIAAMKAKENYTESYANRIFIGDPALRLRFPENHIIIDSIEGVSVSDLAENLTPGQYVSISGHIEDNDQSQINDFDGELNIKAYYSQVERSTLGNDAGSVIVDYLQYDSLLCFTNATVENGSFRAVIIMPSNIDSDYRDIRFSFYSNDEYSDANGIFEGIQLGGEPNRTHEIIVSKMKAKAYPTVFSDFVKIELESEQTIDAKLSVFSSAGLLVHDEKVSLAENTVTRINNNFSNFKSGVYMLHITDGNSTQVLRLVKI
ncbi:MAG: type IX secretion system sortase PorU [Bacteroidales bacterium]|nr:type IX secretion system sortase PorU [Bacteroidales bacterium]